MRVQCAGCQAAFSVPDEKIPEGKEIKILCPRCRAPIELVRQGGQAEMEEGEADLSIDAARHSAELMGDDLATMLACVSNPSYLSAIQRSLGDFGYHIKAAPSTQVALSELRHSRYDVVVLDEEFDGAKLETNPVLLYLQPLPMQMRRQFFLCVISTSLQTNDQFSAFRMGADLVISSKDLGKAKPILSRTMKEHKRFYKVLRDELSARGRV